MAVLHNAAEQIPDRLATRPPVRETVGPCPTTLEVPSVFHIVSGKGLSVY